MNDSFSAVEIFVTMNENFHLLSMLFKKIGEKYFYLKIFVLLNH